MRPRHMTGPGAGAEKYDLLTALAVAGLSGSDVSQASMLRLIAMVTARYNWSMDEVSIGHRELAALWSVDERTAKRETKRLVEAGILALKTRGTRGRVSSYRLCLDRIYALSEPVWAQVGRDFHDRMAERQPTEAKVMKVDFSARPMVRSADSPWERMMESLAAANAARHAAWYARLRPLGQEGEALMIEAGSGFVLQYVQTHLMAELETAARAAYPGLRRCQLVAPENRL